MMVSDIYSGKIRMLNMLDEHSPQRLTIDCGKQISSDDMIERLANAMIVYDISSIHPQQ